VGSRYDFAETNPALRFEARQERDVSLVGCLGR
jgi:urease beta subunit